MPRLWLTLGVGVACLVASGVLVSLATAQATGDPAAVIAAYEAARNQRDIDLALSYFADDATLTQRNTTFSGKTDIRRFLEGFSTRARFNTVSDRQVNGNRVTWTERASGPGTELQTRPPQGHRRLPPPGPPAAGLARLERRAPVTRYNSAPPAQPGWRNWQTRATQN